MTRRDPIRTLAWTCIAIGLAIAILGSGYVIRENRAIAMPTRTVWTPPARDERLPVWPFFYSGTGIVAYGVLLLVFHRPDEDDGEGISPRDTRAG
jgi:hypothetical protein